MTLSPFPIELKNPPSPQQAAIYDAILHSDASLVVQATAGAGKTTTLVNATQLMLAAGTPASSVLFVAFNKAIVDELKARLPAGVTACTMHSFGYAILRDHLPKAPIDKFKYSDLIKDALADEGIVFRKHPDYKVISDSVRDLVNTVRLNALEYDHAEELLNVLEDTQDDFPKAYAGRIVAVTRAVLQSAVKVAQRRGSIDFTDMIWLPWKLDLMPQTRYGTVMCDEGQDLNGLQHWLLERAIAPGGRLILVGDRNQAIYGFAGATPDSMGILGARMRAEELPLSVTWRCPSSHVRLAQAVVGTRGIQPAPAAALGTVGELSQARFETQVQAGDVVLGRTNAPLVRQAFAFLKAGRRAKIRGRNIGEGLVKSAESIDKEYGGRAFSLTGFLSGLREYLSVKTEAIYARTDLNDEQTEQKVAELLDRVEVLTVIAEGCAPKTLSDLTAAIADLFSDDQGHFILLSTIHKAKGLEFDTVFIIGGSKIPAPFATRTPEDAVGENCVLFVALTRAKKALYFVEGVPAPIAAAFHEVMKTQPQLALN